MRSGGKVADSTIRNYLAGKQYHRRKLWALAEVLGERWGVQVLNNYGEPEMANELIAMHQANRDQLAPPWDEPTEVANPVTYVGGRPPRVTVDGADISTGALFRNGDKLTPEQRARVQGYIDRLLEEEGG